MSKKIIGAVRTLVEPVISELGYDLVDVEYKREMQGMVLTVFIDRQGGVTLDDCERVSVAVDPLLDDQDLITGSYYLSVSSPGLDRPLKTDMDLNRYLGEPVDIKLYKPVNKCKSFVGILSSFDKDEIRFTVKEQVRTLSRRDIASIKPHIEF